MLCQEKSGNPDWTFVNVGNYLEEGSGKNLVKIGVARFFFATT
jgi:hypothetical protein